ncbi:MAG: HigA family addiction module antitoxin [Thermodesulfobacteriota bacterium]
MSSNFGIAPTLTGTQPPAGRADRCRAGPRPTRARITDTGERMEADALECAAVSIMPAADALGASRQALHRLLAKEMRDSADLAVRLRAFMGNRPGLWLLMQAAHDVWRAERETKPSVIPIALLPRLSRAERLRIAPRRGRG